MLEKEKLPIKKSILTWIYRDFGGGKFFTTFIFEIAQ
jgi:hypothetical protein